MATTVTSTTGVEATAREVYLNNHVEALEHVANNLDNANQRLHRLADRLLGGQPEDDSNKVANAVPDGIVGQCQQRAEALSVLTAQINFALERLEQVA